ncbi:MAG: hypothetical protein AAAB23_24735, partial [Pseudomonas sp.]
SFLHPLSSDARATAVTRAVTAGLNCMKILGSGAQLRTRNVEGFKNFSGWISSLLRNILTFMVVCKGLAVYPHGYKSHPKV